MCGLVAVIPKFNTRGFTHPEAQAFETLITLDTLRGEDSTGIFAAVDSELRIIKEAVTGSQILRTKEYTDLYKDVMRSGRFMVGHNRKATRGTVNDRNAHPFWYEDKVVMVHNGTFVGDHKKHADTEVDSEALAHLLGKHEPTEVGKVLSQINAAYALIWYDTRDNSLNLVRNSQRPLFVLETTSAWLVCSEAIMLQFTLARVGMNLPDKEKTRPVEVPIHQQIKFTFEDIQTKKEEIHLQVSFRRDDDDYYSDYFDAWKTYGKTNTQDAGNNKRLACAWTNPEKEETTKPQNQLVQVQTKKPLHHRKSYAEYIIDDLGTVPMLGFAAQQKAVAEFPTGATVSFQVSKLVHIEGDDFLVYGKNDMSDDIILCARVDSKDFDSLIDLNNVRNILVGKVALVIWKNLIQTSKQDEQSGPIIVQLQEVRRTNPIIIEEGESCGC